MSVNVLNQSNIKYYLEHEPKQFRIFDIPYYEKTIECLKSFKLENDVLSYNYCGNNNSEDNFNNLRKYLKSLGSNPDDQIDILYNTIKNITKIVMSGYLEKRQHYWVTIRTVLKPHHRFDIPRWHCDGSYFSDKSELLKDEYFTKFVAVLKGPGTLFLKTTPEERKIFNKDQEEETPINGGINYMIEDLEYRKALDLKKKGIVTQVEGNQGVIFIAYSKDNFRELCGIHSEPPMDAPRMFLSIVPGTEKEISELNKQKEKEIEENKRRREINKYQLGGDSLESSSKTGRNYYEDKYLKYKNKYLKLKIEFNSA